MLFRNTFTANDKYTVPDCENLSSRIQMQISSKEKIFLNFFLRFLETALNFKHFERKDDRHTYFIFEITDYQRVG